MKGFCVFAVLLGLIQNSWSKKATGTIRLNSENTEAYITKFSFSPGNTGKFQLNLKSDPEGKPYFDNHNHQLTAVLLYDDAMTKFDKALRAGSLCGDRLKFATMKKQLEVKDNHFFSYSSQVTQSDDIGAHYWYLYVLDCALEWYPAHPPALDFEATIMNGDHHLPVDEMGLPTFYLFVVVMMAGLGTFLIYLVGKQKRSIGQLHLMVFLLVLAFALQWSSCFLELLHLWRYESDGLGLRFRYTWFAADFLSEVCQGFSELVIFYVLLALANGWTIVDAPSGGLGTKKDMFQSFRRFSSQSVAVFVGMFFIQFSLEVLGRRYEDSFNQFHDFEHLPGYLLMLYRILLCVFFLIACSKTAKSVTGTTSVFISSLRVFGTVYFLAFPIVVFCASLFPIYQRHALVSGASILSQAAALTLLTKLLLFKGSFYKISSVASGSGDLLSPASGRHQKFAIN